MPRRNRRSERRRYLPPQTELEPTLTTDQMAADLVRRGLCSTAILARSGSNRSTTPTEETNR